MSKATVEQPKASRGRQRPASSAPWVAIDVGYGYTKILTQEGQAHVFPSLVAPAELSNIDLSLSDSQETVKLEGAEYIVGHPRSASSSTTSRCANASSNTMT